MFIFLLKHQTAHAHVVIQIRFRSFPIKDRHIYMTRTHGTDVRYIDQNFKKGWQLFFNFVSARHTNEFHVVDWNLDPICHVRE